MGVYSVSNFAFHGSSVAGVWTGYLTFRLSWDATKYWKPHAPTLWGVSVGIPGGGYGVTCPLQAEDAAAGWADYQVGSAQYPISFTDTFIELQRNQTCFWKKYGFILKGDVSGKDIALAEGMWERTSYIDSVGPYDCGSLPYYGNLWEAGSFLGFDFLTGAAIAPMNVTDVYCDDECEERTLLNSPGTVENPVYLPYEAMQMASLISRYYSRKVNVHVASGEYEDTKFFHWFAQDADVEVIGDPDNRPKVWPNEDADYSLMHVGMFSLWYDNVSSYGGWYNHWPYPCNTKMKITDVDFAGLHLHGNWHTLDIERCAFAMSSLRGTVIHDLTKLDNELSATPTEFIAPIYWTPHWNGSCKDTTYGATRYMDPAYYSTKHWDLLRFRVTDEATLRTHHSAAVADELALTGFPFGTLMPAARVYNISNYKWPRTNAYVDFSPCDARWNSYLEACCKNEATGDWNSYDTVFTVKRNTYRDDCKDIKLDAGVGSVFFTNNTHPDVVPALSAKRNLVSDNNTSDVGVSTEIQKHGEYSAVAPMTHPYTYSVKPDVNYDVILEELLPVGCFPTERYSVQNSIGSGSWSMTGYQAGSGSGSWTNNYITTQYYFSTFFNPPSFPGMVWKSMVADYDFTCPEIPRYFGYNAEYDASKFYDVYGLRPLPGSSYVHAGDPSSQYNNRNGTRCDVGHLGGPDGDSALVGRIYWLDSFVPVNYTKIYSGMQVALKADRSSWPSSTTPTFTWLADPGNPSVINFTDNGTFEGKNQSVVLTNIGTYTFSVTVADGLGNTNTASVTFHVAAARKFCVDARKSFNNNVLPFNSIAPDAANWMFYDKSDITWQAGGAVENVRYDGVDIGSVAVNWAAARQVVAPQTESRYYLKLCVAKQTADKRTNNTLRFRVYVVDANGALLFSDEAILKGSNLMTKRNADWSTTYGVVSGYLSVGTNPNLTVYVVSENNEYDIGATKTWIRYAYMAPADTEVSGIYQDLRLAMRHSKPNDPIQLAGSAEGVFFDVPLRMAGKNIAFNVTGGWDESSHNGTEYTVRSWEEFKSFMNYIRFAYFKRQRDWCYNAISANMYIYFPSELSGIHVVNEWPDLPNAWAYDGMNMQMILHAPVLIKDLKFSGLTRAGDIFAYSDSLLSISNKLTVDNIVLEDCLQGLRVRTEHIDLEIKNCPVKRVPGGALIIAAKRSAAVDRKVRVTGNSFEDCGALNATATTALSRDDDIWRRQASFTDNPRDSLSAPWYTYNPYWKEVYDPQEGQIAIIVDDANSGSEPDFEIDNNNFISPGGREALCNVVFAGGGKMPDSRVKIHDNTTTSGKDFIHLRRSAERANCYNPAEPDFMGFGYQHVQSGVDWSAFTNALEAVAWLDANRQHFFAVYGNNVSDMRSIVEYSSSANFDEHSERGAPPILVEDNPCTAVSFAIHYTIASSMTPQQWAAIQEGAWVHIENNGVGTQEKHISWNLMPANPDLYPELHRDIMVQGVIPRQLLQHFR